MGLASRTAAPDLDVQAHRRLRVTPVSFVPVERLECRTLLCSGHLLDTLGVTSFNGKLVPGQDLIAGVRPAEVTALAAVSADPAVSGQWGAVMNWPSVAVHAQLLANGKVMFFGDNNDSGVPHLWDPATNSITTPSQPGYNIHCVGMATLPD